MRELANLGEDAGLVSTITVAYNHCDASSRGHDYLFGPVWTLDIHAGTHIYIKNKNKYF